MIQEYILKKLPMNRSLQYNISLASDDECVVRTGIVKADDKVDSFLHAVLSGYSREYFDLDNPDRNLFLKKFKRTLLTYPKPELNTLVKTALQEVYHFVENYKDPSKVAITNKAAGKVICDIISKDMSFYLLILKEVLPYKSVKKLLSSNKETLQLNVTEYLLEVDTLAKVERNKFNVIKTKLLNLLNELYSKSQEYYTKADIEPNLNNPEFIEVLRAKLERNIFVIDNDTKLPILIENQTELKYDYSKSIVVLKIDDSFEILGKLFERNRIKRDLDNDEPFIENIIKHFNPEPVCETNNPVVENIPEAIDEVEEVVDADI